LGGKTGQVQQKKLFILTCVARGVWSSLPIFAEISQLFTEHLVEDNV
jgi:hypothetical protein